jgi:hypothetical protein
MEDTRYWTLAADVWLSLALVAADRRDYRQIRQCLKGFDQSVKAVCR